MAYNCSVEYTTVTYKGGRSLFVSIGKNLQNLGGIPALVWDPDDGKAMAELNHTTPSYTLCDIFCRTLNGSMSLTLMLSETRSFVLAVADAIT